MPTLRHVTHVFYILHFTEHIYAIYFNRVILIHVRRTPI